MLDSGTRIGPYEVRGRLGEGGMGEVYRAHDERLGRDVALKVLPHALARDPERVARLRREAIALASLNHPNIATIFGFEEPSADTLVLVLEHIDGESLAARLARAPLRPEEALQLCAQIAEALEVAHEHGVVHRDLKPGNVMIGARGLVKVVDFGLARRAGDAEDDEAAGSPGYMSPEQVQGAPQDERADVFAFGCMLYECLTGARAFDAATEAELHGAILFGEPDRARLPERTPARVRELLDRCLDKDPDSRLREMRVARLELEEVLGTRRAAALRAGEAVATPHNLPRSATSFVGREGEIATCVERLGRARLVTLTGIGGSGKTRLAVQVAERRLPDYPDGAWFVDAASLTQAERVAETLASALGLRDEPGRSLTETIVQYLAARRALVILDNCEHLLDPSRALARSLLEGCPEVAVLATSREPLGVAGEQVHGISSLSVPAAAAAPAEAVASEAVRLFVERAKLAQPEFEIDAAGTQAVVDICRRLDGIPLAIELAAARVRVLGVEQIRAKLDDRFRLLTGGAAGTQRHQTLLAAVQWSYDLLDEPERRMLRTLSVFAGGWDLGRATAIGLEEGDEFEVLDRLTQLVHKSWVVVEHVAKGKTRYRLLETVRAYASRQLESAGEGAAARGRHLGYFLALAETAERELMGGDEARWLAELELEVENLLAAFAWSEHVADGAATGLRFAGSIWRFWSARGHFTTGRHILNEALKRPGAEAPTASRAQVLVRAGGLAIYQGDFAAARPLVEESLEIYHALDDAKGVARSRSGLGTIALYQGNLAAARHHNEEGLAIYERLGQRRGVAVCLHNLGFVALCEGDIERAREPLRRSLALIDEVNDGVSRTMILATSSVVELRAGDPAQARALLARGLREARELGAKSEGIYLMEAAAELALTAKEYERAARMIVVAASTRRRLGVPLIPSEQRHVDGILERAGAALGPEALARATAAGEAEPLEIAVQSALDWLAALFGVA